MTTPAAQQSALAAISAIRYQGGNYLFVYDYDGIVLAHPDKSMVGTNQLNDADSTGQIYLPAMFDAARNGRVFFQHYNYARTPGGTPEPKLSAMVMVPQWGWMLGTGIYTNDVSADMISHVETLAVMGQMDQMTQQNAAMVEEATAASHALSSEAGTLDTLMAGSISARSAWPKHRNPPPGRRLPRQKSRLWPGISRKCRRWKRIGTNSDHSGRMFHVEHPLRRSGVCSTWNIFTTRSVHVPRGTYESFRDYFRRRSGESYSGDL